MFRCGYTQSGRSLQWVADKAFKSWSQNMNYCCYKCQSNTGRISEQVKAFLPYSFMQTKHVMCKNYFIIDIQSLARTKDELHNKCSVPAFRNIVDISNLYKVNDREKNDKYLTGKLEFLLLKTLYNTKNIWRVLLQLLLLLLLLLLLCWLDLIFKHFISAGNFLVTYFSLMYLKIKIVFLLYLIILVYGYPLG
jgi:hypothetical protein